jgi:hypothetical protein
MSIRALSGASASRRSTQLTIAAMWRRYGDAEAVTNLEQEAESPLH